MIKAQLQKFWNDTSGATTVEWVIMCAAVAVIGGAIVSQMGETSDGLAEDTNDFFERVDNTGS